MPSPPTFVDGPFSFISQMIDDDPAAAADAVDMTGDGNMVAPPLIPPQEEQDIEAAFWRELCRSP